MIGQFFKRSLEYFAATYKSLLSKTIIFILVAVSSEATLSLLHFWVDDGFNRLLKLVTEIFASTANAQSVSSAGTSIPSNSGFSLLDALITTAVLGVFFYSFYVSIHNVDPEKRKEAKGYAQLFGGVLLGGFKSTIGI